MCVGDKLESSLEGKITSVLPWLPYAVHARETCSPLGHFSDPCHQLRSPGVVPAREISVREQGGPL